MRGFLVKSVAVVLTVCGAVLCAPELFAQGGGGANTVTFTPIVDFGNLFTTLTTTIGPIVAGALGLGLAIWGSRYIYGVIKSASR